MFDSTIEPRPLRDRVSEEITRRGLTQEDAAAQIGMKLRAFGSFLNGHSNPQPRNRKAIMAWLGDDPGEVGAELTRAEWPIDIRVFLDIMGAFLATMEEGERERFMQEETRGIIQRWRDGGGA